MIGGFHDGPPPPRPGCHEHAHRTSDDRRGGARGLAGVVQVSVDLSGLFPDCESVTAEVDGSIAVISMKYPVVQRPREIRMNIDKMFDSLDKLRQAQRDAKNAIHRAS